MPVKVDVEVRGTVRKAIVSGQTYLVQSCRSEFREQPVPGPCVSGQRIASGTHG